VVQLLAQDSVVLLLLQARPVPHRPLVPPSVPNPRLLLVLLELPRQLLVLLHLRQPSVRASVQASVLRLLRHLALLPHRPLVPPSVPNPPSVLLLLLALPRQLERRPLRLERRVRPRLRSVASAPSLLVPRPLELPLLVLLLLLVLLVLLRRPRLVPLVQVALRPPNLPWVHLAPRLVLPLPPARRPPLAERATRLVRRLPLLQLLRLPSLGSVQRPLVALRLPPQDPARLPPLAPQRALRLRRPTLPRTKRGRARRFNARICKTSSVNGRKSSRIMAASSFNKLHVSASGTCAFSRMDSN